MERVTFCVGGEISPLLANLYLHEVVDRWFQETVKPRLRGRAFLIRFADEMVLVFANERDARRVAKVLPKRFERFGLRLHPEKTRLLRFQRPRGKARPPRGPLPRWPAEPLPPGTSGRGSPS